MRVLIVEDDRRLAQSLRRGLEEAGFTTDALTEGDEAVLAARSTQFDAVILDVMLEGSLDGFQVAQALRQAHISTPILMLTSRDAIDDRVKGLEAGADDYLVKPFAFRELVARTRALTRRKLDNRSVVLRVGDVCLDTEARTATFCETEVDLTAKEFAILEYFLHNPGRVLTREQIEEHVWNYDFASESNLVEVYVANIRRKLAAAGAPRTVTTVWGAGYRYEAPRRLRAP
jgi:DNA-binding response OmpR family regulator